MRFAVAVLCIIFGMSLFAPYLTAHNPQRSDLTRILVPPSSEHWLGTDDLGRDVFTRVLYGGRTTLSVALLATVIAVLAGMALGFAAVASVQVVDDLLAICLNVLLSIPSLISALVILTLLGRGALMVALATGLAQIALMGQVTTGAIRQARGQAFVASSYALGATRWHVLRRHILPSVRSVLLSYSFIIFTYSIINSAGLSLLGLGPEPGTPEWGVMLAEGRNTFRIAPWIALAPGIAISATTISLNQIARRISGMR